MMALGGQVPYEVLKAATIGGTTSLGLQSSIGSVKAKKPADLIIYPPSCDTVQWVWEQSMHMKYVMRGRTVFGVEDWLVEVWPRKGRRQVSGVLYANE
jgi:imidazolonepropionase-like amidohydrolase